MGLFLYTFSLHFSHKEGKKQKEKSIRYSRKARGSSRKRGDRMRRREATEGKRMRSTGER
jgi:hypothetical protein